jgi:hypothetical protein
MRYHFFTLMKYGSHFHHITLQSIHSNIIEALLSVSIKRVTVSLLVSHLSSTFPNYNSSKLYPYDIEDGLLIWINTASSAINERYTSTPGPTSTLPPVLESWRDLQELCKDLRNGTGLCILLAWYFGKPLRGVRLNLNADVNWLNIVENLELFERWCLEVGMEAPCWRPKEFATGGVDGASSGDEGYTILLVNFLCGLFSHVQKYVSLP